MKENKYDDEVFFEKYKQMERSQKGLEGAGEWETLQALLPDFAGKRVLDLGCGYGWHCLYAAEHGAVAVTGIDISERMLAAARAKNSHEVIHYCRIPMEDIAFPEDSFDIVLSSLAFHYLESFAAIVAKVSAMLPHGGDFVFSVEHPVFTAYGTQDWIYGRPGEHPAFSCGPLFLRRQTGGTFFRGTGGEIPPHLDNLHQRIAAARLSYYRPAGAAAAGSSARRRAGHA